jgi:serine/threonine-protein kinase
MPLEQLGPYKLERILGRGGMGAVYAGVNPRTGEQAAVKVLSAHLADDSGFRERFKIEVETLKRLLHPNIVQLFAYGEEDGHLFYVMELVNGRSLQDELAAGRRFTWREVTRIGIHVAQALKHAHDRGIIHRDLKPANLMLDNEEHVKLTDFGIAKLYGGTSVTADGGVLGTADYMSPEQADGKQVTARCDLYALGSVLYALLTGRPPFAGRTIVEVIAKLKHDQPAPIRRLAPDTPAELEAIVLQLLEKDPQARIPTALALGNRLKAMEHALSPETRPLRPEDLNDDGGLLPADDLLPAKRAAGVRLASAETAPLAAEELSPARGETPALLTGGGSVIAADGERDRSAATHVSGKRAAGGIAAEADLSAARPSPAAALPRNTTFTPVSERELRGADSAAGADESSTGTALAVGGLMLLAVIAIGGLIYFATRQPTADRLYSQIQTGAEGQGLLAVEPAMAQFLSSYPDDQRAAEVAQMQEQLELERLERRFELLARRAGRGEGLLPIESAYLEAVRLESADPAQTLARLEALVAVFGGPPAENTPAREARAAERCLNLARKQIARLKESVAAQQQAQRAEIERQLRRAAALAATDPPAAAAIWQGLVTLYGDKPWAADLIDQARAALPE